MKKKNKTIKAYEKILREDQDWEFNYLLSLEKKKLERMYNYFSNSKIAGTDIKSAKEIALCLRLLDILQERDAVSREFLRRTTENLPKNLDEYWEDAGNGLKTLINSQDTVEVAMFPVHVNYRNESRFHEGRLEPIHKLLKNPSYDGLENRRTQVIQYHLESLRYLKALYLYNKIRAYCMMNWWN